MRKTRVYLEGGFVGGKTKDWRQTAWLLPSISEEEEETDRKRARERTQERGAPKRSADFSLSSTTVFSLTSQTYSLVRRFGSFARYSITRLTLGHCRSAASCLPREIIIRFHRAITELDVTSPSESRSTHATRSTINYFEGKNLRGENLNGKLGRR